MYLLLQLKEKKKKGVTELVCEINWIKVLIFCNFETITVVIATDERPYLLTPIDGLKLILCIAFVFFRNIHSTFWGWNLHFCTFQETVRSHLNLSTNFNGFVWTHENSLCLSWGDELGGLLDGGSWMGAGGYWISGVEWGELDGGSRMDGVGWVGDWTRILFFPSASVLGASSLVTISNLKLN